MHDPIGAERLALAERQFVITLAGITFFLVLPAALLFADVISLAGSAGADGWYAIGLIATAGVVTFWALARLGRVMREIESSQPESLRD